jgi:pimeloyl-ACP methyl ester carboxylesterase
MGTVVKVPLAVRAIPGYTLRAWFTPPPLGSKARERDTAALAGMTPIEFGGLSGFEAGAGPLVLALHGWGGRAAQMAGLARHLADAGYRVVAIDLPGHAGGPPTDVKQVAAAIRAVTQEAGPPEVVVGHSFAGMALRLAYADQAPPAVVLLAPLMRVQDALAVFGERLRLFPWARRGLRSRLEAWDRDLWPWVSDVRPDQLPGAAVLIVHAPEDDEAPFSTASELVALRPHTALFAVPGAGHNGVLADPVVLERVTQFVEARVGSERMAG